MRSRRGWQVPAMGAVLSWGAVACVPAGEPTVPEGFEITRFSDDVPGARTLLFGPDGSLYVALSREGRIVRLDPEGDGTAEGFLDGLNRPYGLAFHDGWLYVGERHRVVRYVMEAPGVPGEPEVVVPDLPTGGSHWTREIAFGTDGMLYVSVGSSCNVCEEDDPRRAAVTRYHPDGSGETVIAHGIRNSAGLAVHPGTGDLWASQNERDNLGDDLPPEEINILSDGEHFGWPYCYGDGVANPEYPGREDFCATTVAPALEMQAHSAPLGMAFYTGDAFPPEYHGDLFVAFHGSWNRSERTGYKVVRVRVEEGRPVSYEDFAQGWLGWGGRTSGRPVDVAVGPEGGLYVSDDDGGRIWRIRPLDTRR